MDITFDWKQYFANYPDLVVSGIDTSEKALVHWNTCGRAEGRVFSSLVNTTEFNWRAYLFNYPDLVKAGIDTSEKALSHWNTNGRAEGRTYTLLNFNWQQYLRNYPDLVAAGIDNSEKALEHYINNGRDEERNDNKKYYFFDLNQFLINNPELVNNNMDELSLYEYSIKYGKNDNIVNFDWKQYLSNYLELINEDVNTPTKALEHYNTYGIHEGRTFENLNIPFDWKEYLTNYPELLESGINTFEKVKEYVNEFDKDVFHENLGIIVIYTKKEFGTLDCKSEKEFGNFKNRMELLDLTLSKLYNNFLINFSYYRYS